MRKFYSFRKFYTVYGPGEGAASGDAAAGQGNNQGAANGGGNSGEGQGDGDNTIFNGQTFTPQQQEFVNKLIQTEKKRIKEQSDKQTEQHIKELTKIKESATTTAKQKEELEKQIEELRLKTMTEEDIRKREIQKKEEESKRLINGLESERNEWKNRFTESTIMRTLQDEALAAKAFGDGSQIVGLLLPKAKLVEERNDDGQVIGFSTKVTMIESNEEGKLVTLELSAKEAIKKMKDTPEKYGNLFISNLNGGLGGTGSDQNGSSRGKKVDDYKDTSKFIEAYSKDKKFLDKLAAK